MSPETEKVLEKLAKIKRHAESAAALGSDKEAEVFLKKLYDLLLQHNLEMEDLELTDAPTEGIDKEWILWEAHGLRTKGKRDKFVEILATLLGVHYGCCICVARGTNSIQVIGKATSRRLVVYLIVTLSRYMKESMEKARRHAQRDPLFCGDRWAGSFYAGFINTIHTRLKELKARAGTDGNSTALVRISRDLDEVTRFVEEEGIKPAPKLNGAADFNWRALREGQKKADGADITGRALTQDKTAQLTWTRKRRRA